MSRVHVHDALGADETRDDTKGGRATWPVFIVGCHRSGTTLLRYLLDAHPALACPPESKFIAGLEACVSYPQALRGLASLDIPTDRLLGEFRRIVRAFFQEFAARQGKRRWVDKTPNYVRLLPFLDALFERQALYVLMVRHPFDTADSLAAMPAFKVDEPEDPDIAASVARYGRDRAAWVRHWRDINEMLLWFESRAGDRAYLVRYEDLVEKPEQALDTVLAFLSEVRSPELIADLMTSAFARAHSAGYEDAKIRTSGAIHRASVGKWERWPAAEIEQLWTLCSDAAGRLGYDAPVLTGEAHAVG